MEGATLPFFRRFQFSPLREGRQTYWLQPSKSLISILAPARGATKLPSFYAPGQFNFNSRPCERGDVSGLILAACNQISILAPARGATSASVISSAICTFQFSPLREGRLFCFSHSASKPLFQFSPLREGRPDRGQHGLILGPISILAPARGAT